MVLKGLHGNIKKDFQMTEVSWASYQKNQITLPTLLNHGCRLGVKAIFKIRKGPVSLFIIILEMWRDDAIVAVTLRALALILRPHAPASNRVSTTSTDYQH